MQPFTEFPYNSSSVVIRILLQVIATYLVRSIVDSIEPGKSHFVRKTKRLTFTLRDDVGT